MITFLSKCISHFLCNNNVITEEDFSIYQYGFEIIFSTILGFLITIGIGFLLRMEILSILYYIIFVTLRQLTGGYHADSYFKCNLIFTAVSFVTMGMTQLSVDSKQYTFIFYLILIGTSLAVIWIYSPVENKHKPLEESQKRRNHKIGFIYSVLLSIVSCILFKYAVKVSILIILTLFMISMLIIIPNFMEGGNENEQD